MIKSCVDAFPSLELDAQLQPITRTVLRIQLTIRCGAAMRCGALRARLLREGCSAIRKPAPPPAPACGVRIRLAHSARAHAPPALAGCCAAVCMRLPCPASFPAAGRCLSGATACTARRCAGSSWWRTRPLSTSTTARCAWHSPGLNPSCRQLHGWSWPRSAWGVSARLCPLLSLAALLMVARGVHAASRHPQMRCPCLLRRAGGPLIPPCLPRAAAVVASDQEDGARGRAAPGLHHPHL